MSLKAGIIGLPNVGKSTLFNAITKQKVTAANYPFATIDPNVGVVIVPDYRLDILTSIYNPKETISTTFEFTDIAGLVKGASKGEGLGNKFLSHIRETDAIVEVIRAFDDDNISHVEGRIDPLCDIEIINLELVLADLELVESKILKIEKKAKTTKDKEALFELEVFKKIEESLKKDIPIRKLNLDKEELLIIKSFNFLTLKPIIYVANIGEEDLNKENELFKSIKKYVENDKGIVLPLSAKIESELSELTKEEKDLFLNELNLTSSGLDKLIKATYDLLNLRTYFTAGEKEVRAWTFKKDMNAKECAGIIHSDFEKGFIRAEVISFSDIEELKSEVKVKEKGKMRLEGKDYKMQDGDICHFRFNI